MTDKFIIGLDSSTQMTKAIAWNRAGQALGEGRAPVPMSRPAQGRFEQNPEDWWCACCTALADLGKEVALSQAAGLAISNQRETVGFIDKTHRALRPGIVWLDERATPLVQPFAQHFGAGALHRITGKPVDITPVVYRLHWMQRNEPETLAQSLIVDVHGCLSGRLTGECRASWTSADPFGIFDLAGKCWSEKILQALDLRAHNLPPAVRPGTVLGGVSRAAADASGLPMGLPIIAAGGDGQCAGLGANATRRGVAYLNLGTAIVVGAWDGLPRISQAWRTMSSPTGEGYFLEGVQRAGTFLVDWLVETVLGRVRTPASFAELSQAAKQIPIAANGLLVCPYLSGCMNPHWSSEARAAFFGLTPEHGPAHLYRATLEALTGEIARSIHDMRAEGVAVSRIVAVGGGATSALWLQMIADATGLPIQLSNSPEASSLGAAMSAAVGLGWFADFAEAAEAMSTTRPAQQPIEENGPIWQDLLARQDRLNRMVVAESGLQQVAQDM